MKGIGRDVSGAQEDVANLGDLDRLFAQIKRDKGKLDVRSVQVVFPNLLRNPRTT